jgi:uncharacterized protein (TIGR03067 family)
MCARATLAALLVLALAVPLFAAAPPPTRETGVPELQGGWVLEAVQAESGAAGITNPPPMLVIRGERLLYGGEVIGRIWADPAAEPKSIDLRLTNPERTYEGIYTTDKDTLTICLHGRSEGIKERPSSFSVKDHPDRRLLRLSHPKEGELPGGAGFVGLMLRADDKKVVVQQVLAGSPAEKAGLRAKDVVRTVQDGAVSDLRSAVEAVRRVAPGKRISLGIRRGDREIEVTIKVGFLPFGFVAGLE